VRPMCRDARADREMLKYLKLLSFLSACQPAQHRLGRLEVSLGVITCVVKRDVTPA